MNARVELPLELRPPIVAEREKGSGTFVRLSDSYLDNVVYLGIADPAKPGAIETFGTGFLLGHDEVLYLVTAAHVARTLEAPFSVRLNRADKGGGQVDQVESGEWTYHEDDKVDVAVIRYTPPRWARVIATSSRQMVNEFKRERKNIGVGDLAYVVGVFQPITAKARNVPVVHTGHIACMDEQEPIPTKDWRWAGEPKSAPILHINGYLVQVPTMEQSSGSPVFVRRSLKIKDVDLKDGSDPVTAWQYGSVWLLGLWHGAWTNEICNAIGIPGVGMGITIPATKIIETLNQPTLVSQREKEKASREYAATPQARKGFGDGFNNATQARQAAKRGDALLKTLLATSPEPKARKGSAKPKRAGRSVSSK